MKKYLTIDIGRRKLGYAVITEELDVLEEGISYTSTKDRLGIYLPIKRLADQYRHKVEGISISMPGVIDPERGFAYSGGIYQWVQNIDLSGEISALTGMKTAVCNDAKSAALAEIGYGSLKKVQNGILLMILNTGIGGAVKVNGQLLNGAHFAAGEFSYMKGDYRRRDANNDMFAWACSLTALNNLVKEYTGDEKMNIIRIMAGLNEHDETIEKAVREYAERLAVYIYNIQCVFDAEKIVLGGGIMDEPLILHTIEEAVQERFAQSVYHNIYLPEVTDMTFHSNGRRYGAVYHFREVYEGNSWHKKQK